MGLRTSFRPTFRPINGISKFTFECEVCERVVYVRDDAAMTENIDAEFKRLNEVGCPHCRALYSFVDFNKNDFETLLGIFRREVREIIRAEIADHALTPGSRER